MSEKVVVRGKRIHREEYAYFLVIDGTEIWGYERDPTHPVAVHGHEGSDHARTEAKRKTFKQVVDLAWKEVTDRAADDQ